MFFHGGRAVYNLIQTYIYTNLLKIIRTDNIIVKDVFSYYQIRKHFCTEKVNSLYWPPVSVSLFVAAYLCMTNSSDKVQMNDNGKTVKCNFKLVILNKY